MDEKSNLYEHEAKALVDKYDKWHRKEYKGAMRYLPEELSIIRHFIYWIYDVEKLEIKEKR